MSEENVLPTHTGPFVDFSFQLNLAREKAEKKIFNYLSEISQKVHKENKKIGALVVLGVFGSSTDPLVEGMRKLTNDKLDTYININFPQFKDDVIGIFNVGDDGAIIVNQDGQILGSRVYLTVDNPTVEIPEGTGTRHISAASFSTREDVLATFTLSEETWIVRTWKDGKYTEQFNPSQKEDDE